jgi:hypothetical protein
MRPSEIAESILGRVSNEIEASYDRGPEWHQDRDKARRIFDFLENRRVLYSIVDVEVPAHCVESVLQIRQFLTGELLDRNPGSFLADSIRSMRAACRRFLDRTQRFAVGGRLSYPAAAWEISSDLGELRALIGQQIARIAVYFDLDVEGDLIKALPPSPE